MVNKLRKQVKELLLKKEVDLVIGWGRGSQPMISTPIFIKNA